MCFLCLINNFVYSQWLSLIHIALHFECKLVRKCIINIVYLLVCVCVSFSPSIPFCIRLLDVQSVKQCAYLHMCKSFILLVINQLLNEVKKNKVNVIFQINLLFREKKERTTTTMRRRTRREQKKKDLSKNETKNGKKGIYIQWMGSLTQLVSSSEIFHSIFLFHLSPFHFHSIFAEQQKKRICNSFVLLPSWWSFSVHFFFSINK